MPFPVTIGPMRIYTRKGDTGTTGDASTTTGSTGEPTTTTGTTAASTTTSADPTTTAGTTTTGTTGEPADGYENLDLWLCHPDKAVDDDKLMAEAGKLAGHLATQPTYGLGLTKRAIQSSADNSLDAQLDLERNLQREAGRSPDYAEGVRAFLEKRPPQFIGRKA